MINKLILCLLVFTLGFARHNEDDPKMVLILGDSLAAGYGLQSSQAFPALLQQKIDALGWDFKVINAGLSGDTSAGGLRRIDWLLRGRIDVLVLELGANDGLRGIDLATTRANLQGIIDKVKAKNPNTRILIAGMMVPPNLGQDYTRQFQQLYPELARRNQATLIPFLLDGVAGDPTLNLPDGIHPTAQGHRIVSETVWTYLKPVLQSIR